VVFHCRVLARQIVKPNVKHVTVIVILSSTILLVAFVFRSSAPSPQPAPIVIMARPYAIQAPPVGLLDRIMPQSRSWGWLWRLRYAVLGKSPIINLDSSIIDCSDSNLPAIITFLPDEPDLATSDGTQIWRLKTTEIQALRRRLKERPGQTIASPRIATGDKAQCRLYTGPGSKLINGIQQQPGLTVELVPTLRKATNDLTAIFCLSELVTNLSISTTNSSYGAVSIETNLDFAGRFQLTPEMPAIFVLPPPKTQKRLAVLVTSTVQKARK
jgi:hypothetical protein